jgi:hypothetical protein
MDGHRMLIVSLLSLTLLGSPAGASEEFVAESPGDSISLLDGCLKSVLDLQQSLQEKLTEVHAAKRQTDEATTRQTVARLNKEIKTLTVVIPPQQVACEKVHSEKIHALFAELVYPQAQSLSADAEALAKQGAENVSSLLTAAENDLVKLTSTALLPSSPDVTVDLSAVDDLIHSINDKLILAFGLADEETFDNVFNFLLRRPLPNPEQKEQLQHVYNALGTYMSTLTNYSSQRNGAIITRQIRTGELRDKPLPNPTPRPKKEADESGWVEKLFQ